MVFKAVAKPMVSSVLPTSLSIVPGIPTVLIRIRGVNCDYAVNKLLEYNLITELGRKDAPGRPLLFGTTEEFLRSFGVKSLKDLPELDTLQIEEFKHEAEEEINLTLKI